MVLFLLCGGFLVVPACLLVPHTRQKQQPTLYGLKTNLYRIFYIHLCSWVDRERIQFGKIELSIPQQYLKPFHSEASADLLMSMKDTGNNFDRVILCAIIELH